MTDATYKLNDLRMPLYLLLCVDGNGESHVVSLWIVANEEQGTIAALIEKFISRHPNIEDINVIMADEDFVEIKITLTTSFHFVLTRFSNGEAPIR